MFPTPYPRPHLNIRIFTRTTDEVRMVKTCAGKWDAMVSNYNEQWDIDRRDSPEFLARTKHIRFLFEVRVLVATANGVIVCVSMCVRI